MQFVELSFLLGFLPLTLFFHRIAVGYRGGSVYGTPARVVLFLATLIFYGYKEPWWLIPFGICVGFDFVWASLIHRSTNDKRRKKWVICSVVQNLLLLGFFKYFNFGIETLSLQSFVPKHTFSLPPGISFYTFESLSFVIDVYRRKIAPPTSPLQFFAFIGMFPRFIAGPIVRYKDMVEQFTRYPGMQWDLGFKLFGMGCFLKLAIADRFALWVPFAFESKAVSLTGAWIGVISYTMQIYFDFYGYSLMAIGLGRILGFEFPANFHYPYSSDSLKDFWRRWHISLSTWLRDYLYIPLGGNQKGQWKTYRNLILTMLLGGLWHGANWTFVAWGVIHGLGLAAEKALGISFGRMGTFLLVVMAWIFFRADSLTHAFQVLGNLFGIATDQTFTIGALPVIWCASAVFYVQYLEGRFLQLQWRVFTVINQKVSLGFILLALVIPFKNDAGKIPFLYFQF